MILYKKKWLLILGTITPQIGRLIKYRGKLLTVLPWNVQTYRLCTRLRLNGVVPNPSTTYPFSLSPYKPYQHQLDTFDYLLKYSKAFCWNEAGTGKTACCLWGYDALKRDKLVKKLLIISPLSTTRAVWGLELFRILTATKHSILVGPREKRLQLLQRDYDIYVINHDGIKVLREELIKWQPDMVIVDEHTAFKKISTQRWKALNAICKEAKVIWMLSGTPTPQAPVDAYAPARIVCPELVGRSQQAFKEKTMYRVSEWKWLPRENFEQVFSSWPVIRFSRDDCLDLPDVVYQTLEVGLSKKQELTFNKLKKEAVMQAEEGTITAVNEGVMRSKLLQCCAGYVYTTEKDVVDLLPRERLETLKESIEESARGVLIFIEFRSAVRAVKKYLEKTFKDLKVVEITGDVSLTKRTRYFQEFQDGKIQVIIAHPQTMAHGVTLTYADTVIWYLVTSNNEMYEQANSRIQRIGQTHKMRVLHFVSTQLEKNVLRRLQEKQAMQGVLLETLKNN